MERQFEIDGQSPVRGIGELEAVVRAVELGEALARVGQADTFAQAIEPHTAAVLFEVAAAAALAATLVYLVRWRWMSVRSTRPVELGSGAE